MDENVGNSGLAPKGSSRGGLRLLQLAAFFSSFDRFAVAPMLVTIAASLGTSLAGVAATASLYYLLYGGMQPVWGMLSDRLGRVRVMRLTLFGAVFAGMISALAPNLAVLAAARALAGGLFAAVIPAALVYVGDTVGHGFPAESPRGFDGRLGSWHGIGDRARGASRLPRRLAPRFRGPCPGWRRARPPDCSLAGARRLRDGGQGRADGPGRSSIR